VRPPSDSKIPSKARGGFLRAGFRSFAMVPHVPDLPDVSNLFRARHQITENVTKQIRQFETVSSDKDGTNEKPAADLSVRAV
jgi:hypothetical protein